MGTRRQRGGGTLRGSAARAGAVTIAWLVFAAGAPEVVCAVEPADADSVLRNLVGLEPSGAPMAMRVLVLVTVLGIVPSIILLTTCFPRILILLSFLRRALGTQDLPPQSVVTGLALVLTVVVMLPVWREVHAKAYAPLVAGEIETVEEALARAERPIKEFMLRQTLRRDLALMLEISGETPAPATSSSTTAAPSGNANGEIDAADLPIFVVLPAFVLSELKLAFQMGFLIFLPFVVIDLVVSAVLLSMGMFMLPPVLVSLPLKVLVFVMVDGWNLIVGQMLQSFA